jgi:hypothetical protein
MVRCPDPVLEDGIMAKRKKPGDQLVPAPRSPGHPMVPEELLRDVRDLILQAREATA